ncbi:MAG: hypothetical protein WBX25_26165 [Rhodomicrobium sp.]
MALSENLRSPVANGHFFARSAAPAACEICQEVPSPEIAVVQYLWQSMDRLEQFFEGVLVEQSALAGTWRMLSWKRAFQDAGEQIDALGVDPVGARHRG